MSGATLRLIILVSCAHTLVHVYEQAFPSVEKLVAVDFGVDKEEMGLLGTSWRLPFGGFAIVAGWLTDRYGAKRMLVGYLFGCSAMTSLAAVCPKLGFMFLIFFAMGTFASIYHPAGLALISHRTAAQFHPRALGVHGVFGSLGVAAGPFIAAMVLSTGATWRSYLLFLSLPGLILACWFAFKLSSNERDCDVSTSDSEKPEAIARFATVPFVLTLFIGAIIGFVYAATMNFMPRYLSAAQWQAIGLPPEGVYNYMTAGVLLLGVIGQYSAGRMASSHTLELWLASILGMVAPCLFWMAVADGSQRVAAAAVFSITFFMTQPVYNSLVPKFVPAARRSFGYGLSFMLSFGVGSLGASFAGFQTQWSNYGTLALLSAFGAGVALLLWRVRKK